MKHQKTLLLAMLLLAAPLLGALEFSGTIVDTGNGVVIAKDNAGKQKTFRFEAKTSSYEPTDWRPHEGDAVKISYEEVVKKNDTVNKVDTIKVVKMGAFSKDLVGPTAVIKVTAVSKRAIKGNFVQSGREIRMEYVKGVEFLPDGEQPQEGDKVELTFEAVKAAFTFGLSYQVSKVKIIK